MKKATKGSEGSKPNSENIRSYPEAKAPVVLILDGPRMGRNSAKREGQKANLLAVTDHPVVPPAHRAKAPTANESSRRRLRIAHDLANRFHVKHGSHSEQ
jgi:hypothetical protein